MDEVVDRLIPLSPEFSKVARVPPIRVEASVRKLSQLSHQVHVAVEQGVEDEQPDVGSRDSHFKC